ncbi:16S rRNA (cytidine(1402)-2'-O)-methyltransferase [Candidatus Dojkabacteria bacterium CG_4_9_14_3_um_filter_150_Dojkabacteria_WS6_41_13]|nr:MAG: 16S rRNA (cytidine(1402)-2'-O)-methyltransferase [Candidatus Dojkabacteria bacterium CG_4_10_14_3_um_filter_Dojkabacteria_WS6_41_9]PJB22682.1 MAG: 16S rRNA (cytidine(1402)-2'-O)-methyltransferase [Candidatus Dojkabacteria bacterium CG_4_9_14_3_um_filter_150_Dojkabacteria_WS6_41_13]
METGTLYMIATPIGNLGDISQRALDIIGTCDYLISETPAVTKKLLTRYGIKKAVNWYRESNHKGMSALVLDDIVIRNMTIGVVSEAGTPVVSDPGAKLLSDAYARGVKVIPIPGSSAVTTAISAFPVASAKFLFWGFAPRKEGEFRRMITDNLAFVVKEKVAIVYFESPFRLKKTLGFLVKLGKELEEKELELRVGLGKEMTKVFEAYVFDTPEGILNKETRDFKLDKGEATLVIVIKKRHNERNGRDNK